MRACDTSVRRRLALLTTALLTTAVSMLALGAAAQSVAAADSGDTVIPNGGGANNVVIGQTFADGSSLVRSHTQVAHAGGNTIQSSNVATALATGCTGCHSTAVAVQVLLVTGSPQYFAPHNVAAAVNSGCTSCGTFAYAWQYTPQVDRSVTLTPEGRHEIQTLKAEIDATAASIVPATIADDVLLQTELDALTSQLKDVIDSQLTAAGAHANGQPVEHIDQKP
jgi:hypothetical protein